MDSKNSINLEKENETKNSVHGSKKKLKDLDYVKKVYFLEEI